MERQLGEVVLTMRSDGNLSFCIILSKVNSSPHKVLRLEVKGFFKTTFIVVIFIYIFVTKTAVKCEGRSQFNRIVFFIYLLRDYSELEK